LEYKFKSIELLKNRIMKKFFLSLAVILGAVVFATAQNQVTSGPAITVDKEVHDVKVLAVAQFLSVIKTQSFPVRALLLL
jgi:hypothetical protein